MKLIHLVKVSNFLVFVNKFEMKKWLIANDKERQYNICLNKVSFICIFIVMRTQMKISILVNHYLFCFCFSQLKLSLRSLWESAFFMWNNFPAKLEILLLCICGCLFVSWLTQLLFNLTDQQNNNNRNSASTRQGSMFIPMYIPLNPLYYQNLSSAPCIKHWNSIAS